MKIGFDELRRQVRILALEGLPPFPALDLILNKLLWKKDNTPPPKLDSYTPHNFKENHYGD